MSKLKLGDILRSTQKSMTKHSPEILTGFGIAGIIMTVIFTVEATRTATVLVEEEKRKKKEKMEEEVADTEIEVVDEDIKLTPIEIVKTTWKPFIPVFVTCGVSVGCMIGINSVHMRRYMANNAAWATAYQLSANAMSDYRARVIETIGEEKEKPIHEAFVKDRIDKDISENNIVNTRSASGGNVVLFYDEKFGQTFYATPEQVDAAVNSFNSMLNDCQYGSLNEWYDCLGIRRIGIGETLGWNRSRDDLLTVFKDSIGISPNGSPCFIIDYAVAPKYGYHKENPRFIDNY